MTNNVGKQEGEKDDLIEEAYSLLGSGSDELFFANRLIELQSGKELAEEKTNEVAKITSMLCHVLHII